MLKKILLPLALILVSLLSANEPLLVNNHSKLANQMLFAQNSGENSDGSESTGTLSARKKKSAKMKEYRDGKSPLIASGLSLLVPGAGEIYGEDYLLGGIFLGVEASLWTGYLVYESKGNDKTTDFKNFANTHFKSDRYLQAIWQMIPDSCRTKYTLTEAKVMSMESSYWSNIVTSLGLFLGTDTPEFTHQLPTVQVGNELKLDDTQQYYEMIGKYHQFASGWDDFNGWVKGANGKDSVLCSGILIDKKYTSFHSKNQTDIYENMRDEANQAYEVGTNFLMLAVLNRVASAFDAAYVIKRDFTLNTALRFENNPNQAGPISANNYKMSLNFRW